MMPRLHDHEDLAEIWSSFKAQRVLGVGIAALAFTPLVQNATDLWGGGGRFAFILATFFLATSILIAQASMAAHRAMAAQNALYANVRRKKEFAIELKDRFDDGQDWQSWINQLNQEDLKIAEDMGQAYRNLDMWLWAQYTTAVAGGLAVVAATILSAPV
jgi:hypothetical protein